MLYKQDEQSANPDVRNLRAGANQRRDDEQQHREDSGGHFRYDGGDVRRRRDNRNPRAARIKPSTSKRGTIPSAALKAMGAAYANVGNGVRCGSSCGGGLAERNPHDGPGEQSVLRARQQHAAEGVNRRPAYQGYSE